MFYFSRGEQVALAVLLVALVAAGAAMWWVNSHARAPSEPFFVDAPAAPTGEKITVHVCGEVAKPGLYTVDAGARIYDLIKLAGGATDNADLEALNLAAEAQDGQQVRVPAARPALASAPGPAASPESASDKTAHVPGGKQPRSLAAAPSPLRKIDINRAGAAELDLLPGIGPIYARRIIEYRERLKAETGQGFTRVEQLMEVPGIGPKRFADVKDHVTL